MSGIPYFQAPQDFLIYERNYVTKCTSTGATYSGFCIIFWIWVFGRALDLGLWIFWSVDFSGSGRANSFEATSFESGTFPMTRFLSAWRRCSTVWTSSFSATISSHSTRILKIKLQKIKIVKWPFFLNCHLENGHFLKIRIIVWPFFLFKMAIFHCFFLLF